MDERAQAERRAWRLALLLTGRRAAADAVTLAALASQPDLLALPEVRRDRLVLLRAREWAQGAPMGGRGTLERMRAGHQRERGVPFEPEAVFQGVANAGIQLALALGRQSLEAWALHRIEGLELREVARSMDCSTQAAARYLDDAETRLSSSMGADYTDAMNAIRAQALSSDPGPMLQRRRTRVLRARMARHIAIAAVLVAGLAVVGLWLLGR